MFSVPLDVLDQITLRCIALSCSAVDKWIWLEALCHAVSLLPAVHDNFYRYTAWNSTYMFFSSRFEFAKSEHCLSACSRVQVASLKQPLEFNLAQCTDSFTQVYRTAGAQQNSHNTSWHVTKQQLQGMRRLTCAGTAQVSLLLYVIMTSQVLWRANGPHTRNDLCENFGEKNIPCGCCFNNASLEQFYLFLSYLRESFEQGHYLSSKGFPQKFDWMYTLKEL